MRCNQALAIGLVLTGILPPIARAADQSQAITLASYNILADQSGPGWKARSPEVVRFLADPALDVVGLQEVTERQMGDIARASPHFSYVVGERSDGMRGDQGWYEYNPILYRGDRFELVDAGSFWVSEAPRRPGSILPGTKRHARVFTWARLRDLRSGVTFFIGNAHLHGLRGADEIKIAMNHVASLRHRGPAAVLGDFNATSQGPALRWITSTPYRFQDAAVGSADERQGTVIGPAGLTIASAGKETKLTPIAGTDRIDYILTCGFAGRAAYRVAENRIHGAVHASDHKPIVAAYLAPPDAAAECLGGEVR